LILYWENILLVLPSLLVDSIQIVAKSLQ